MFPSLHFYYGFSQRILYHVLSHVSRRGTHLAIFFKKERFSRLRRPPPSHSRLPLPALARLGTLLAPGGFASPKTTLSCFWLATLAGKPARLKSLPLGAKKEQTRLGLFFFWRRRRDLNSRAGLCRPTPLAGAPLRPT